MYSSHGLFLAGKWRPAADGATSPVRSPVTGAIIGTIPVATPADQDEALAAAESSFSGWATTPAWDRAAVLRRSADYLRADADALARVMATETGKPISEARAEVMASADQFEWQGEEAKRVYGQAIPGRNPHERLSVTYQPVGPCLALTAWNFPMLLPARKIAAALAAGCSVVARPASEAPGSSFALADALIAAGLPEGVLSVLTGPAVPMVERLIRSPVIRKVSLTGSVSVGKQVLRIAAEDVKKVTMELGGHAPVIVHADTDPVAAARKLAATKFRNSGQVCISPSRFYVHRAVLPAFETAFAEVAREIRTGDGLDPITTMGPMIRARAVDAALDLIADAVDQGARLLAGGTRPAHLNRGHFLEPTVLGDVPDAARIMHEEPFAPVAPIAAWDDFDQVIARANDTEFGLAAYVFTENAALAARTAEALEAGMVGINETLLATAEAPFGGTKQSGFGREGGSQGILDYMTPKYTRHRLTLA
ncbi:MAG: NAD-dependent succinate-semialdehyde dehydrogenase [Rhodobacterales bacterium]|nr:NAD-dependent succinate-semialdehyde dehydrogenase [Rhodobacterales bacterium]